MRAPISAKAATAEFQGNFITAAGNTHNMEEPWFLELWLVQVRTTNVHAYARSHPLPLHDGAAAAPGLLGQDDCEGEGGGREFITTEVVLCSMRFKVISFEGYLYSLLLQ